MAGSIYGKPVLFAIVATLVILVGTVATMFLPMFTPGMHPKLADLEPYTALQLAGKDVYQQEGCNNCHTQTVRPLRTEVMRYGEYSKAGEFAYDRPFLWGSKRTGPDLARIGGKYPDAWHYKHFERPQDFYRRSNMPAYGWLAERKLKPSSVRRRMEVNGFPFTDEEIRALEDKSELDALVAYVQAIGAAVKPPVSAAAAAGPAELINPLADVAAAVQEGQALYDEHCAMCHGEGGSGDIGANLEDFDADDPDFYTIISEGYEGEMPGFAGQLDSRQTWSIISYVRSLAPVVKEPGKDLPDELEGRNPMAGKAEAVARGKSLYEARCAGCHGADLSGGIGPCLTDRIFAGIDHDGQDGDYYDVIAKGRPGGMPVFGNQMQADEIWAIVTYIRSCQAGE